MNNFNEMPLNNDLLLAMYNTPSKELSTKQIAEIISSKLSTGENTVNVDNQMVSQIYKTLGESLDQDLDLRKRLRVAPKPKSNKPKRVTKGEILNNIYGQLGLLQEDKTDEGAYPDSVETPQEQEYVDEAVENHQFEKGSMNGLYS